MGKQSDLLLDAGHLHTAYRLHGKFHDATDDVNLTLERDEILTVVGESGYGKSIIASSITGLYDHGNTRATGDTSYDELNLINLDEPSSSRVHGSNIGMTSQDSLASLNPLVKVGDQIAETLCYHTGIDGEARRARVVEFFNQAGMPRPKGIYKMYPRELSGGLRQHVVITIAIVCRPEIIITDESTTALGATTQAQILDLLREIQKESRSGITSITHDLGVITETADQVATMYAGQIVEKADVKAVFENSLHPYIRSPPHSMLQTDDKNQDLHVIRGTVPSLVNMSRADDRFVAGTPWILVSVHEENSRIYEVEPRYFVRCICWQSFHLQDKEKKG